MTLKNSFLASLKENNKRRIWLWILSALAFIVALPVLTALNISMSLRDAEYFLETMGPELGRAAMEEKLLENMARFVSVSNEGMWLVIAAGAVISGLQGFSYLFSRKKIDFYMGMPVKRKKRFLVIWLNGIFVFLIPYVTGLIISALIMLTNQCINASVLQEMATAVLVYLCFYLGIYHLAILAVMLTGNIIITCFGIGLLFLYEWAVRLVVKGYMELYFKHFSYYGFSATPLLSPFAILFTFVEKYSEGQGNAVLAAAYLFLFAAAVLAVAYFCYLKRPLESAGKAMAFSLPKPVVKIMVSVLATLLAGIVAGDIVGYSPVGNKEGFGLVLFVMIIVLLVSCCLIQVVYEFDIRGILHKKRHILISGFLTAAVFSVFRFDIFGYDSYIPSAQEVESAAFIPDDYTYYYGENYFDEEMNYLSKYDYVNEYMYLTDVGALCKAARLSVDAVNEMDSIPTDSYSEEEEWYQAQVIFRTGSNRKVCRKIYLDLNDETIRELLEEIHSSEEFVKGYYMGASEVLERALNDPAFQAEAYYGNPVYLNRITREEGAELLRRYREDIKKAGFLKMRESIPSGNLVLSYTQEHGTYNSVREVEMKIYPFFTECVSYLKEKGYYMEQWLAPSDVERIQITNYNSWMEEEKTNEEKISDFVIAEAEAVIAVPAEEDYQKTVVYEDEEIIRELAGYLYPDELIYHGYSMEKKRDPDYYVAVYFDPESRASQIYGSVVSYCFIEGEIPDFVAEDTRYQE